MLSAILISVLCIMQALDITCFNFFLRTKTKTLCYGIGFFISDDMQERAGSTNILHMHGEIFKMRSEYDETLIAEIRNDILLGDLAEDGAQLRPHIVWFEEPVPLIEEAARITSQAEIFVVIGTSL